MEVAPVVRALTPAGVVAASDLPLCVDLDGTLLRTDTLQEAALAVALSDWRALGRLRPWLKGGRAYLKQQLAARWSYDVATLPYNTEVIALIERARAEGRHVVLCTAADRQVANAIAEHLKLFDEVIASDGTSNLRGPAKAEALVQRFGRQGFCYIGNDSTDLAVWQQAASAIVVGGSAGLRRAAARVCDVEAAVDRPMPLGRALAKALRPHQWSKNLLCLVPVLASGATDVGGWVAAIGAMLAFCATASAIYLMNDLSDLRADRAHPRKRNRPFASGALPLLWGVALAPALLLAGGVLGWLSGALWVVCLYAALSTAYTLRLKELPLVDTFVLAALYTVRVIAGGVASGHPTSLWLLGFSAFLFLSLALIKRVSELTRLAAAMQKSAPRRGYRVQDLAMLQQLGCASSFASAVVLSLYVQSDVALTTYHLPQALWGAIPLLLFWQCRLWLATSRGYMHDDPIVYAASDRVSWATFACLGVIMVVART
jgi:4-hydroxybenzoate polyprenyltransferase/phosphoserine phosphatase